jgi:hypothetical protein
MDLLGPLGETRDNAQPPNPTRDRGSSGGQTPSLLLAWVSAPPIRREEVVRETGALADELQPEPPAQRQIKIHIRGLPGILDEAIQQNPLPVVDKQ